MTIVWMAEPGAVTSEVFAERRAAEKFAAAMSRLWPGLKVWLADVPAEVVPAIRGSLD